MKVPEPREPLSVGAVVIWTIINPLFGLIALGVRNSALRDGEPKVTKLAAEERPVHAMGRFFRGVVLIIAVIALVVLSAKGGGK